MTYITVFLDKEDRIIGSCQKGDEEEWLHGPKGFERENTLAVKQMMTTEAAFQKWSSERVTKPEIEARKAFLPSEPVEITKTVTKESGESVAKRIKEVAAPEIATYVKSLAENIRMSRDFMKKYGELYRTEDLSVDEKERWEKNREAGSYGSLLNKAESVLNKFGLSANRMESLEIRAARVTGRDILDNLNRDCTNMARAIVQAETAAEKPELNADKLNIPNIRPKAMEPKR